MRGGANRADPVMVTPDDRPLAFWGRAAGNLGCNRMRWHPPCKVHQYTLAREGARSLSSISLPTRIL